MSADGPGVWLIAARDDLVHPDAVVVRVNADGSHDEIAHFAGYAFDPHADRDHVYVVSGGSVVRVGKGPGHEKETIARDQPRLKSLAVDDDGIVWTNMSTEDSTGKGPFRKGNVMRAKSDGSDPKELAGDARRGVVMDRDTVYFGGPRGGLFAVPRAGGRTRTLVEPGSSGYNNLALDGAWLVFTRQDGVSRVDTRSGRVEKVADGIPIPLGIAARDGVVYVAVNAVANRGATTPAALARLRIGDGKVQTDWLGSRAGRRAGPIAVTATDAFMVSRPETETETLLRVSLAP